MLSVGESLFKFLIKNTGFKKAFYKNIIHAEIYSVVGRLSPCDVLINLWCQSDVLTKQEVGRKEMTGDIKFQTWSPESQKHQMLSLKNRQSDWNQN